MGSAVSLVDTKTGIHSIAIYLLDTGLVVVVVMFMVVLLVLVVVRLAAVS